MTPHAPCTKNCITNALAASSPASGPVGPVLIVVIALTLLGPERHGVRFGSDPDAHVAGSGRFTRATEREPVGARS